MVATVIVADYCAHGDDTTITDCNAFVADYLHFPVYERVANTQRCIAAYLYVRAVAHICSLMFAPPLR